MTVAVVFVFLPFFSVYREAMRSTEKSDCEQKRSVNNHRVHGLLF